MVLMFQRMRLLSLLIVAGGAIVQAEAQRPQSPENRKAVSQSVGQKAKEIEDLRSKATRVTERIGALASSGKLPTTDESIALLKELVQELASINEQLKRLQEDVDGIKSWISGQKETLPKLTSDVDRMKRITWGNYMQFQWTDTQEPYRDATGTRNDGFNLRRVRLSATHQVDSKSQMRISADFAAGAQRIAAELRDAFLTYTIEPGRPDVGTTASGGQMILPLGYDLGRSSSERELPERALYNRTMFAGERGRGVNLRYGIGGGAYLQAGLWNTLTVGDPQQTAANSYRNVNGAQVAATGGIRHTGDRHDVGLGVFVGERPRFTGGPTGGTVTAPSGDRRFVVLDGAYTGLAPNLSVRGEVMLGKDRLPTLNSNGTPRSTEFTDMLGWQAQLTYRLNGRNHIAVRYEFFDPNTDADADATRGLGLSYLYSLSPQARLMIAHERFDENPRELRDNVTTIRIQFRL